MPFRALLKAIAILLLGACATTHRGSPPAGATAAPGMPSLDLVGSRIIACCCPSPCPCRLDLKPTNCHGCDHTDAVHFERGTIDGVAVDGVTYCFVGRGFGEDVAQNWAYVYVDDDTTAAQQAALQKFLDATIAAFGDKAGHLCGKFLGLRRVPMTYTVSADRRDYACAIPGVLDLKTRAIVNPGRTAPAVSSGILDAWGDRFVHAECLAHKYDDPSIRYSWDLTGRQCNQADFAIDSARLAKGGIGWGCWTAHGEFGDRRPYGQALIEHECCTPATYQQR